MSQNSSHTLTKYSSLVICSLYLLQTQLHKILLLSLTMASSSSSAPPSKYDVFISFRGKEIRKRFLSRLFDSLVRKQINAFLDEKLDKGEEISPALLKIIRESSLSIVIFSENYADSPWCLDELVKILECKETLGQIVLPVFYEVDPTDVQEPRRKFKDAFDIAKHEEQVKGSLQKVDKWKRALIEVSNLSDGIHEINDPNNLKRLVRECDLYHEGSRIIVTSRDRQVLINVCSNECIYEVEKLDYHEELQLFGLYTFKQDYPKQGYRELSLKAVTYAGDGVDVVSMHDLIQQMGKDIVIEECKQLGGRSRLWNYEDVRHVLTTNTGTKNIEVILLHMYGKDNLELSSTAFRKMCNLRILEVKNGWAFNEMHNIRFIGAQNNMERERVLLPNNLEFLPEQLRYLYWDGYPLTSLPLNFCPRNLVELHMPCSKLIQLWHVDKPLGNLKLMDLSCSEDLIRIPDLSSTAPNLEFLYLSRCRSLVEIPSSLQYLSNLTELYLHRCYKITDCPEIPFDLRILILDETGIEQLPSIGYLSNLVKLSLRGCTRLASLPSGIGNLKHLEELDLRECSNLPSLPESIKQLSEFKLLYLNGCKRLKCLPELPSCLQDLNASDCTSFESASSLLFQDDNKFYNLVFDNCVNLEKNKVLKDIFEAHLLGQTVFFYIWQEVKCQKG